PLPVSAPISFPSFWKVATRERAETIPGRRVAVGGILRMRTVAPGPSGVPSDRDRDRFASTTMSPPTWRTWTFCAGRGRMRTGAWGGPFLPQPAPRSAAARPSATDIPRRRAARRAGRRETGTLQDVAAQVLVLHDVGQHSADIVGVDR